MFPGGAALSIVNPEAVRAERVRILSTLLRRVDALSEEALATIRSEIPAYAAQNSRFLADAGEQVNRHYRTKLTKFLEERAAKVEDVSFVRGAASRRVRAGFALEDYITAYRVGQQVFWDAVVSSATDTTEGHEAALNLAAPLMQYCDFASQQAVHAYVEFQQARVGDSDRDRYDLLESLLAGELPTRAPLLAAARTYGFGSGVRALVVTAVPVGQRLDAELATAAATALERIGLREPKTLVVARDTEIVALPVLRVSGDAARLCDRLEQAQERLRQQGMPLAVGISTVATGAAELPQAHQEARSALECVADDGGVIALPRLSLFDYLAQRADHTARYLVDPRVRALLQDDRARGGVLVATIRAFADANLNLREAAAQLQVHHNTAQYRLRRVEERTGRNPRRIGDLLDLLLAIALDDTATPPT